MEGRVTTPEVISEENVHDFRKEIDSCIKKAQLFANCNFKEIGSTKGKRENALVITKLQEAKHWAGEILGEIGSKLPEEYRDEA